MSSLGCPLFASDPSLRQQSTSHAPRIDYCRGKCQATTKSACINRFLKNFADNKHSGAYAADNIYEQYDRCVQYSQRLRKAEEKTAAYHSLAAELARRLQELRPLCCGVCTKPVTANDILPGTSITTMSSREKGHVPLQPQDARAHARCSHCSQTVHMQRECSQMVMAPATLNDERRICARCVSLIGLQKPLFGSAIHEPTLAQQELRTMELQMRAAYEAEQAALLMAPQPLGVWDRIDYGPLPGDAPTSA